MIERETDHMARHEPGYGARTLRRRGLAGSAGRMTGFLLVATSLLVAACGSGPTAKVTTPPPLPTITPTPPPQVLFQSDWSQGLAGWNASPGWSVVNGALVTSTDAFKTLTLTIPYQPAVADYEIEVDMQLVNVPRDGGFFLVHALPKPDASGFFAGVTTLRKPGVRPNGDHPTNRVYIDPLGAEDPRSQAEGQRDYEPGPDVRHYLFIVQGPAAQQWVDGQFWTAAQTIETEHLSNNPIRIECTGAVFRITSIRILTV
jgi:hypothetical protein